MHEERVGISNGAEPTIVAFFCNWCTYTAADLAGTSRTKYPPNARVIRVMMASGQVASTTAGRMRCLMPSRVRRPVRQKPS